MKEKNLKRRDGLMGRGYYLDFTFHGKRARAFGGYSLEAARAELVRLKMECLNEDRGLPKPVERVLFKAFADETIDFSKVNGKRSTKRDKHSLKHLSGFFTGYLDEVTAQEVEGYKRRRLATGTSPATLNRELAFLRSTLYKAVDLGRLKEYPLPKKRLLLKEPAFRFRVLTQAEAKTLMAGAADYLKPILLTLLATGMRKTEALRLKWPQVDFGHGLIEVLAEDAKSGKARSIPMSGVLFDNLMTLKAHSTIEYVFPNRETGRPFADVKKVFAKATKAANLRLRVHDLRHTFATWAVQAGVDLVTLMHILGHSSLAMVLRYAHPGPQTMRDAVEKVSKNLVPRQKLDTVEIKPPVSPSIRSN